MKNIVVIILLQLGGFPLICWASEQPANVVIGVPKRVVLPIVDRVDIPSLVKNVLSSIKPIKGEEQAKENPFAVRAWYEVSDFELHSMSRVKVAIVPNHSDENRPQIIITCSNIKIAAKTTKAGAEATIGKVGPGVGISIKVSARVPTLIIKINVRFEDHKKIKISLPKNGVTIEGASVTVKPKQEKLEFKSLLMGPFIFAFKNFFGTFLATTFAYSAQAQILNLFQPMIIRKIVKKLETDQTFDLSENLAIQEEFGDGNITNSISFNRMSVAKDGSIQLRGISQWGAILNGKTYLPPVPPGLPEVLPDAVGGKEVTALIGTSFVNQFFDAVWHVSSQLATQHVDNLPINVPSWMERIILFLPSTKKTYNTTKIGADITILPPVLDTTQSHFRALVAANVSFAATNVKSGDHNLLLKVGVNATAALQGPTFTSHEKRLKLGLTSVKVDDLHVRANMLKEQVNGWVNDFLDEVLVKREDGDIAEVIAKKSWFQKVLAFTRLDRKFNKFGGNIQKAVDNAINNAVKEANKELDKKLKNITFAPIPFNPPYGKTIEIVVKDLVVKPVGRTIKVEVGLGFHN